MSYITLNKSHFFHNLQLIEQHIGSKDKIAIVLKDNAYGHGLIEIATLAAEYGLLHAVVRTCDEAQKIEKYFKTILVLADTSSNYQVNNVHTAINDLSQLSNISSQSCIELKIDTGMHRNGLDIKELKEAFKLIQKHKLKLKGVFTHHRSADVLSSEYFWQEKNFLQVKTETDKLLKYYEMPAVHYHSQNSAATFRTKSSGDIVRVGIAAYGLLQMPKNLLNLDFKPVLSLWAHKLHTIQSKQGYKHGYEGKGFLKQDHIVSTYDVGYADGLLRLSDHISYKTPQGASLLGRVSMDNVTFTTDSETLCLYDNAITYALAADTISYEVTVRLASHIKRTIVE